MKNEISNALFNVYDIKKTVESHGFTNIKRVHGGTENEDTLGELISDVIYFLEKLEQANGNQTGLGGRYAKSLS